MKSLGKVALVGLSGVVVFKVGTALILPMLGLLLGLVSIAVKVAVVIAVGYFVMEWLKKDRNCRTETHDDHGIDVEVEEVEIEVE